MMTELSSLGKAALSYAKRGFYVFPLRPLDKRPLISDNFTQSTVDPDQIRAWWGVVPSANIGLDCGKSGVVAIDGDTKNGGMDTIAGLKLLSGGGKKWNTWQSKTPSGGSHFVFKAPDGDTGLRTSSGNFGLAGVDVRTRGGYIVLPPSRLSSGAYETVLDLPLLPIPSSLVPSNVVARDLAGRTQFEGTLQDNERIPLGAQDTFLTAVVGRLARIGFNEFEMIALLRETYNTRCEPPPLGKVGHTDADFLRLARGAKNYVVQESLIDDATAVDIPGEWNDTDQSVAVSVTAFLQNNKEETAHVVEGLLQATSLNMLAGPPKAGKSTIARGLALDVAMGLPFMGRWKTTQTSVLYYTLQENKAHLHKWLVQAIKARGYEGDIPIDFIFHLGKRGMPAFRGMMQRVKERKYGFVIIDMFGRLAGVQSLNDYDDTEAACDALKEVADATNTCILWLHHERKAQGGFEGAIGSQAIRGSVYTTLRAWKENGKYFLASEQRDGDDLPDTSIIVDKKTGIMRAAGSRLAASIEVETDLNMKILSVLKEDPKASVRKVKSLVPGGSKRIEEALRQIRAQIDDDE